MACRSGIISRTQVVYLVQDYEPGFFAWSSESSIAASTYHAGFAMAVNSIPLRDYLVATEDVVVGPDTVFAPNFDVGSMKRVAASPRGSAPHSVPQILFYGRPGKPRNMFTIVSPPFGSPSPSLRARGGRSWSSRRASSTPTSTSATAP